jgi:Protein of unknown function (DUF2637)
MNLREMSSSQRSSLLILTIAVISVVVVASIAAIMSYEHLASLAERVGERYSFLFPISIDGMIVASSMALLVRRRAGRSWGVVPVGALLLGIIMTVFGNIASAEPTILARVVAASPPVVFAISFEILLSMLRPAERAWRSVSLNEPTQQTSLPELEPEPVVKPVVPAAAPEPVVVKPPAQEQAVPSERPPVPPKAPAKARTRKTTAPSSRAPRPSVLPGDTDAPAFNLTHLSQNGRH